MKRIIPLTLALLALLATPLARAWTYNDGDLLLVFRESGHKNIEFDLGSVGKFLGKTNGYTTTITGWDTSLVTTEFGADLTGVKVILLASAGSTNWLSSAEPNTTAYNISSGAADYLHGIISAVGTKPLYPINIPVAGTNSYSIDPGGLYTASSYDYIVSDGTLNARTIPKLGGNAPFTVEQGIPSLLDFWAIKSTTVYPGSPPDTLLGTFTITTNGVLKFVAGPRSSNIIGISRAGNVSAVQFTTTVGNTYSVLYTNALGGSAPWPADTGSVVGDGKPNLLNRTNSSNAEFYRVQVQ